MLPRFRQRVGGKATLVCVPVGFVMLGASKRDAASLQAKSLRFGHVGSVPVVSRKLGAFK